MSAAPMPKTVKVGAHVYSVLSRTAAQIQGVGECDNTTLQIKIKQRLKRSKAKEILLHEILHAVTLQCLDGGKKLDDEDFITATSPVLLQVLQDNPELLEYLTQ